MTKFNRIYRNQAAPDGGDPGSPPPSDPPSGSTPPADPPPSDPPSGSTPPADPPSQFYTALPDDWRGQLVSGLTQDEKEAGKLANQLERYTDLPSLIKSGFEAQDRIRKGEMSTGLPDNPSDEQLVEYREANGIPEKAEGYLDKLTDGVSLGEADKRILSDVFETAHQYNIPGDTMKDIVDAYMGSQEKIISEMTQQHTLDKQEGTQKMKEQWGADFETNVNLINNLLNSRMPEEILTPFKEAQLPNGKKLFNSPEAMVFFAQLARELNPAGVVVPNSNNPVQSINDEIASLEARMGTDEWYKDQAANDRLLQLYEARERIEQQ